jgi:hypothetical protein
MSKAKRGSLLKVRSNIHSNKFQKDIDSILSSSDSPDLTKSLLLSNTMSRNGKDYQSITQTDSSNTQINISSDDNNISSEYDHLFDDDDVILQNSDPDDDYTDDDTVVPDNFVEYRSQSENDTLICGEEPDTTSDCGSTDSDLMNNQYSSDEIDEESIEYMDSDSDPDFDDRISKQVSSSSRWINAREGRKNNNNNNNNSPSRYKIQYTNDEFVERAIEVHDAEYYKKQMKYLSIRQRCLFRKDLEAMMRYVGDDIVNGWEKLLEDTSKQSKRKLSVDQLNRLKARYNALSTEYHDIQRQVYSADSIASRASRRVINHGLSLEDIVTQIYQLFHHKYKIEDHANSLLREKIKLAKSSKLEMITRDPYAPALNIFLNIRDQMTRKFFHKHPDFMNNILFKSKKFTIEPFTPTINHPSANCYFFSQREAKYILKMTISNKRRKICLSSHAFKPIQMIMSCYFLLESIDYDRTQDNELESVIVQKYTKILHDTIIRVFKNNKRVPIKKITLFVEELK